MDLFFSFNGRINRAKWWLGNILLGVILGVVMVVLMMVVVGGMAASAPTSSTDSGAAMAGVGILGVIIYFVVIIAFLYPICAINAKRWHDRGRAGWFCIFNLIPIVNIWGLIECGFLSGVPGPNEFGPNPLGQ